MNQLGGVPPKYLADWTERVAKGELPHAQPQRPRGVERNIVATVRDWSTDKAYMHDLSGTDRRNPTVNAYGKLYGAPELSTDEFPILDPKTNTATVASRTGAGPEHADDEQHAADAAFALLGQRGDLGQQSQRAQSDAR